MNRCLVAAFLCLLASLSQAKERISLYAAYDFARVVTKEFVLPRSVSVHGTSVGVTIDGYAGDRFKSFVEVELTNLSSASFMHPPTPIIDPGLILLNPAPSVSTWTKMSSSFDGQSILPSVQFFFRKLSISLGCGLCITRDRLDLSRIASFHFANDPSLDYVSITPLPSKDVVAGKLIAKAALEYRLSRRFGVLAFYSHVHSAFSRLGYFGLGTSLRF